MILRDNPRLQTVARRLIAARPDQQGVSPSEITDEVLRQRINNDEKLCQQLTQVIVTGGYIDADDPDLVSAGSGPRKPSDNTGRDATVETIEDQQQSDQLGSRDRQFDGAMLDGQYAQYGQFGQYGQDRSSEPGDTSRLSGKSNRGVNTKDTDRDRNNEDEAPKLRRHVPPYGSIPSLRDLYTQTIEKDDKLERFGADVFRNSRNIKAATDVPAGPDYVIGPGDGLNIDLWGGISRRLSLVVDREGRISLPEAGTVMVAGRTLGDSRQVIQNALATQFQNVHSDVSLTRVRSVRVYVVGDVVHPGAYNISALSTALNALYAAGGTTAKGSLRRVKHYRGNTLVADVDIYDLLLKGVRGDIAHIQPGDTILVPPVGPQVTVAGSVRRPAIYELKSESGLNEVLDLAGGVLVSAALRDVRVERIQANEGRTMISVETPASSDLKTVSDALSKFKVEDGDRVLIGSVPVYSSQSVYVTGHVVNPGKFSYRQGLQITDVLRSFKDLLPEPADRAEIVRLEPPDMKPRVLNFNIRSVLAGRESVALQPFDTVRIYGRYDYDAPSVSILGEIMRPGEYPMSDGMTAVDLLRMAGGFKRGAYTKSADLASYSVESGRNVEVEHREVAISDALNGVQDSDVRLKAGDVLTVRQLSGWLDIGAAIRVSGEVGHPGTYGIEKGERLSSVLKRAGGFMPGAYAKGAVLTRVQVREMDLKAREALMRRIEGASPQGGSDVAALSAAFAQQQQMILKRLREQPVSGRQVIRISPNISEWENSPLDIELRAGDELIIPKTPTFVAVEGQVNSPSAITFIPGKKAEWYLRRAGGPTEFANQKGAFIVRADGSVVGRGGDSSWWGGGVMSTTLQPGDTVVIPERIITDNALWRNLMNSAQVISSVAIAARVATSF